MQITPTVMDTFNATDAAGNSYTINEYASDVDGLPGRSTAMVLRTPDGRDVEIVSPGLYRIPTLGLDLELAPATPLH